MILKSIWLGDEMRTRELIKTIEVTIQDLERELEIQEEEYKRIKYIFKKKARILLNKINWTRGNINASREISKIAKIPSKST